MRNALEANEDARRWLLVADDVVSTQASIVFGAEGLRALVTEFVAENEHYHAAKATYALGNLSAGPADHVLPYF